MREGSALSLRWGAGIPAPQRPAAPGVGAVDGRGPGLGIELLGVLEVPGCGKSRDPWLGVPLPHAPLPLTGPLWAVGGGAGLHRVFSPLWRAQPQRSVSAEMEPKLNRLPGKQLSAGLRHLGRVRRAGASGAANPRSRGAARPESQGDRIIHRQPRPEPRLGNKSGPARLTPTHLPPAAHRGDTWVAMLTEPTARCPQCAATWE